MTYSSRSNSEPLSDGILSVGGVLDEDMLLGDVWDVIPVSHVGWQEAGPGE